MTRENLERIIFDLEVTDIERKIIAKEAGYSGEDGGIQGLKRYLKAPTKSVDDKNVFDIVMRTIGYGRLVYLSSKNNIEVQYEDYIERYIQEIRIMEKNLQKLSFEDSKKVFKVLAEVIDNNRF